jgi:hypothetical protein
MRKDFFIENDSGAFTITSAGVVPGVIEDGRQNDAQFARDNQVILVSLVGDDSFIARVVHDEPLSEPESREWIAHIRSRLTVSGGKLVICSGYDPDLLADWSAEPVDGGDVWTMAIPDGDYLVDVYTYLQTMNGRVFLENEWNEKLGAWFRRDHPGRPFPSWVAGELAMEPQDDPGHEDEWDDLPGSIEAGTLAVETSPLDWVGFLIHLSPPRTDAELSQPSEDGFFAERTGLRKPPLCPLGLPSAATDPEYREALSEILDEEG